MLSLHFTRRPVPHSPVNIREISSFYAQYTPKLVERFLDFPKNLRSPDPAPGTLRAIIGEPFQSVYFALLGTPCGSPYFIRYIRSKSPKAEAGKRLALHIASSIIAVAPKWYETLSKSVFKTILCPRRSDRSLSWHAGDCANVYFGYSSKRGRIHQAHEGTAACSTPLGATMVTST